jgi:hypothetical protein
LCPRCLFHLKFKHKGAQRVAQRPLRHTTKEINLIN